jgi:Protein of unknown function (DUF541)
MSFRLLALLGLTLTASIAPSVTATANASSTVMATALSSGSSHLASATNHSDTTVTPTQIAARPGDRTIVVSVTDSASTPVEQVQMKYTVYDSGYYDYQTEVFVEPEKLPIDQIEAALIASLSQAGIPASDIDLSYVEMGMYGSNEISVIVTLPASHTAIGNATDAITTATSSFSDLTTQTVGIRLGTSRCDELAGEARRQTIDLARERGTIIAEAIGATLGDITNVYESYQDLVPYNAATCLEPSGEFPPVRLSSYGGEWTMYMDNAPLEIELSSTLDVTFSVD